MSDIERKAFLEWWESRHYDDEDREVKKAAWCAWQAARQAPASGEVEPVAWASPLPDGTEQVTKEFPERIYGVVPKDYQWYVRPLVYADTHPPAKVPEGWQLVPVEPTTRQVYAAEFPIDDVVSMRQSSQHAIARAAYRAMLGASPTPATTAETDSVKQCSWWKDMADWDGNTWESDCGACWVFIDEGPAQNEMNYCPKCGRKLSQLPPQEQ